MRNPNNNGSYEFHNVVKKKTLSCWKLEESITEKNISIVEISKALDLTYTSVLINVRGHENNQKIIDRVTEYVDSVDVRFRNIKDKCRNHTSLKRLGFSKWEAEQILETKRPI